MRRVAEVGMASTARLGLKPTKVSGRANAGQVGMASTARLGLKQGTKFFTGSADNARSEWPLQPVWD